jgi:beta-glucosidase
VLATLKRCRSRPAESGVNVAPAQISERELRENFFPPFRKPFDALESAL